MTHKIKEVADLAGVSVRTLHHYDEIGLLKPATVTAMGYRLYSDDDLDKLQQILFFKELGLPLNEIKEILDNPRFDRRHALEVHRELLLKKVQRLETIINTVDQTLESLERGNNMNKQDMFEGFDMTEIEQHQQKYAEETKQKYGHTDAYRESAQKTSQYTKEDWAVITAKGNAIYTRLASLMDKGPADTQVQEAIGDWRRHITDSFYNCTLEIFRGLGDLYVADERFTANIDRHRPGLALFMRDAMHLYCDNQDKK